MSTVYLAGPINGCTDAEALDWREDMADRLRGHEVISPMTRDYRGKEDENVEDIVQGDKDDIRKARVLIAYCPKPSVGTSMEVLFAWQRGREYGNQRIGVIVYAPPGAPVSPWLRFHSDALVHSAEDAVAAVNGLL